MKFYFSLLLFHFCIFNYLNAEKFTVASIGEFEGIEQIRFQSKRGPQTLYINKGYVNLSHKIPEDKLIHFYSYKSNEKETSAKPVLRIEFPTNSEQIILLHNEKEIPSDIGYEILDNSLKTFPFRSIFVYNKSDKNIVGFVDDTIFKIKPYSKNTIPLSANEYGTFNGDIEFYKQNEKMEIQKIYSSYSRLKINNKLLFVFSDSEKGKQLNVHKLALSKGI